MLSICRAISQCNLTNINLVFRIDISVLKYVCCDSFFSISAQTNFAVGAVLNASFGSIVELILYETALVKDIAMQTLCYNHLVKSALIGTCHSIGLIEVLR